MCEYSLILCVSRVRFYAVQIILALGFLHKNNVIYREYESHVIVHHVTLSLKPENVLIDKDGYIKLADFGLSKENITSNRGTNSLCGTAEYLAPEILLRMGHGKAVDWWTLGITSTDHE